MKYLFPLILFFAFLSCTPNKKEDTTYFGGKIVHPKSKYVVLFNFEKAIDTIYLKENNTFLGEFKNITEGLYYFKHGPEHQYIYLEPEDSLLLRLNTWDFDESLVFSGDNATKNNVLIESFLENEKERRLIKGLSTENPDAFFKQVNHFLYQKDKKIDAYKLQNPEVSNKFLNILNISYKYPIYTQIEDYIVKKGAEKEDISFSKSFLKHRNNVSMGLDSIMFFHPYSQYVMTRIYSDTYQQGFQKNTDAYTVALLKNIDKNIHSKRLKNVYLKHTTLRHFYNNSSDILNAKAFSTFLKLNTNTEDKENIQQLLNDAQNLTKGDKLPDFKIINYADKSLKISNLLKNKNSLIYFRNPKHYSDDWVASRINYLTTKNPEITIITVNVTNNKGYSVNNLNINEQYYLPTQSFANNFLTSNYPRTILVNKNGIITNSFGALSSLKIEAQIADLQKN